MWMLCLQMRRIVELLGQPEDRLLFAGIYTEKFFMQEEAAGGKTWRLMVSLSLSWFINSYLIFSKMFSHNFVSSDWGRIFFCKQHWSSAGLELFCATKLFRWSSKCRFLLSTVVSNVSESSSASWFVWEANHLLCLYTQMYPKEDAEHVDRLAFVDLVKRLLDLDGDQRISPSDALQQPFITRSHLCKQSDSREW